MTVIFTSALLSLHRGNRVLQNRAALSKIENSSRLQHPCNILDVTYREPAIRIFTDNQVVSHLLSRMQISRREVRCIDFLAHINISRISLKTGRLYLLRDGLIRIQS